MLPCLLLYCFYENMQCSWAFAAMKMNGIFLFLNIDCLKLDKDVDKRIEVLYRTRDGLIEAKCALTLIISKG